jgi:hypothetical protein
VIEEAGTLVGRVPGARSERGRVTVKGKVPAVTEDAPTVMGSCVAE